MTTSANNNFGPEATGIEPAGLDGHLSEDLRVFAQALDGQRATLSEAALRRMIAGTVPLVVGQTDATSQGNLLRVVGEAEAWSPGKPMRARPVAQRTTASGPMRLAASIAVVGGLGFAIVAQRETREQTPTAFATARVQQQGELEREGMNRDGMGQALAQATVEPGDDDVLLWESWLAAADVSRSEIWSDDGVDVLGSERDSGRDDDSGAGSGTESGNGGLDWLDLGTSPVRGGAALDEEAT
jgi:hypothetical protein